MRNASSSAFADAMRCLLNGSDLRRSFRGIWSAAKESAEIFGDLRLSQGSLTHADDTTSSFDPQGPDRRVRFRHWRADRGGGTSGTASTRGYFLSWRHGARSIWRQRP